MAAGSKAWLLRHPARTAQAPSAGVTGPDTSPPPFLKHAAVTGDGGGNLTAVSCVSPKLCVAVDGSGSAVVFTGRSWSKPRPAEAVRSGIGLTGVSCPRADFCVAVDDAGAALTFNGRSWSRPVVIDNASTGSGSVSLPLTSVSCATPHFCVATDAGSDLTQNGDFVMFDGTNLSAAQTLSNGDQGLTSVSCTSPRFCVAVSDGGTVNDSGGYQIWQEHRGWTVRRNIAAGYAWTSVSCVSARFCVASDQSGNVSRFNGARWTRPKLVVPIQSISSQPVSAVSCASSRACIVVAGNRAAAWHGTRWGTPVRIDDPQTAGLISASCPAATFCAAVDAGNIDQTLPAGMANSNAGETFASAEIFNGRRWREARAIDRSDYVAALSCFSAAFCELTTAGGMAASFNGRSWGRPAPMSIVPGQAPQSLSCPAAGICVAADTYGNAFELRAGRWRRTQLFSNPLTSGLFVSCATPMRCVAVTGDARFTIFNGKAWSRLRSVRGVSSLGFDGISCPERGQVCTAVTADGTSLTLRRRAWSAPVTVSQDTVLVTVSCASRAFCLTSDGPPPGSSDTWRFNGAKWIDLHVDGVQQFACSAVGFCAGNEFSNQIAFYQNGRWTSVTAGLQTVYVFTSSVSCVGSSFCMVTDAGGQAFWS